MANELTYQSEFTGQQMDERFTAVARLSAALEALTDVVAQKYVKPAAGIPSTDMDADVQAALAKALTAVQSLADYYTKDEVDALLAAINAQEYVDVSTLPTASASTMGKIYLVGPDGSGYYSYYISSYDGSAYSWVGPLGTTEISLANYATKAELNQLDQEVNGEQAVTISLSQDTTSGTSIPNIPAKELSAVMKAGKKYKITWTGLTSLVKNLTFYTRDSTDAAVASYWNGGETSAYSFTAQVASFDVIPSGDVSKMRLYAAGTNVVGTGTIGITIENYPDEGIVGQQIKGWILNEAFTLSSATRDSDGNVSAASVVWPDGQSGTLTITRDSDGAVTQVVATHGTDSYTLSVTRDSSGNVTSSNLS